MQIVVKSFFAQFKFRLADFANLSEIFWLILGLKAVFWEMEIDFIVKYKKTDKRERKQEKKEKRREKREN